MLSVLGPTGTSSVRPPSGGALIGEKWAGVPQDGHVISQSFFYCRAHGPPAQLSSSRLKHTDKLLGCLFRGAE